MHNASAQLSRELPPQLAAIVWAESAFAQTRPATVIYRVPPPIDVASRNESGRYIIQRVCLSDEDPLFTPIKRYLSRGSALPRPPCVWRVRRLRNNATPPPRGVACVLSRARPRDYHSERIDADCRRRLNRADGGGVATPAVRGRGNPSLRPPYTPPPPPGSVGARGEGENAGRERGGVDRREGKFIKRGRREERGTTCCASRRPRDAGALSYPPRSPVSSHRRPTTPPPPLTTPRDAADKNRRVVAAQQISLGSVSSSYLGYFALLAA